MLTQNEGEYQAKTYAGHAVYRHRTVLGVAGKLPTIGDGAFVAPSAALIGDVSVGKGASIWYGTVLRGTACPSVILHSGKSDGNAVHA